MMSKLLKAGGLFHVIQISEVLFKVKDNKKPYIVNNKKSYVVNLKDIHMTVGCGRLIIYHAVMQCLDC